MTTMNTIELRPLREHKTSKAADSRTNLDSSSSRSQPKSQHTPYSFKLGKRLLSNKRGEKEKEKEREESGEREDKEGQGREEIDKRERGEKQAKKDETILARFSLSLQEGLLGEALNQDGAKTVRLPDPVAEPSKPTEAPILYAGANKASTGAPVVATNSSTDESTSVAKAAAAVAVVAAHEPLEITFNRASHKDIGGNCFRADRESIPEDLTMKWETVIKTKLDLLIQRLIQDTPAGFDVKNSLKSIYGPKPEPIATTNFCMAGPRDGTNLRVEPTILVCCSAMGHKKKIDENMANSRPEFLDEFDCPVKVCYDNNIGWGAATVEQTQIGALDPPSEDPSLVRTVYIEHNTAAEGFGLRLRFETQIAGLMQRCYSRLGGILYINGLYYGMTTAHTLFIASKSIGTITEDLPPGHKGAVSLSSAARSESSESSYPSGPDSLYKSPSVQSEWLVLRNPVIAWSFQGQRARFHERSVIHGLRNTDWALISIPSVPHFVYGSNNTLSRPLGVIQEMKLHAGHVSIRCGTDKSCEGFLTQTSSSLHTWDAVIDVREILLDVELFEGASGSWVLRDDRVCGYIIAVMGSKLSCLMIPMERAFQDIEDVLGSEVRFPCGDGDTTVSTTNDPVPKSDKEARPRKKKTSHPYQIEFNDLRFVAERIQHHLGRKYISASTAQDLCTICLAWTEILHLLKSEREAIGERRGPISPALLRVCMAYGQHILQSLERMPFPDFDTTVRVSPVIVRVGPIVVRARPVVVRSLNYLSGLPKRAREHAAALTRLLQVLQAEDARFVSRRNRGDQDDFMADLQQETLAFQEIQ